MSGTVHIVIDGQWGSTGKGKAASEIAQKLVKPAIIHADFQPNAGHTIVVDGKSIVTSALPSSAFVCPEAAVCLGPASCIDLDQLHKEVEMFEDLGVPIRERLLVHPNAGILEERHGDQEKEITKRISSTMKGTGVALSEKVLRTASLASDYAAKTFGLRKLVVGDTSRVVHNCLVGGKDVLFETAQGFDLSLNHGMQYPYVTSRDVTPASVLGSAGLPASVPHRVWGVIRTYPIRVGNVEPYTSGPFYGDQVETTWEHVADRSGYPSLIEKTTVTNRVRRVFTFSKQQLQKFVRVCAPDFLYLNFANYLDSQLAGVTNHSEGCWDLVGSDAVTKFITDINQECERHGAFSASGDFAHVVALGTGPNHNDVVWLRRPNFSEWTFLS